MSKHHLTETRFDSLPLDPKLQQALKENGFEYCTPIQEAALPVLLEGRDCAGQAQTGTGKTLAFLLACMNRLLNSERKTEPGKPRTLILAPTRELAIQIHKDAEQLARHTGQNIAICYGGKAYEQQKVCTRSSPPSAWCSTRPTACSTWVSSRMCATCCGACRSRRNAFPCCSPPPWRRRSWSWPTST